MRDCLIIAAVLVGGGCTEGVKLNPLPRAGVSLAGPKEAPPPLVDGKTLYERLGREDGLVKIVNNLVVDLAAQPKTRALSSALKKRALVEFLMEVSSRPRPKLADDAMLTPADWTNLLPALRTTLSEHGIPDADRDELLANIEKSR